MSKAGSRLIEAFLTHYRWGFFAAKSAPEWRTQVLGRSPEEALEELASALHEILEGKNVDEALGVQRSRGAPPDPLRVDLKFEVYEWWQEVKNEPLLEKQKWAHVKEKADQWLTEHGREPVSEKALEKMLNEIEPFIGVKVGQGGTLTGKN